MLNSTGYYWVQYEDHDRPAIVYWDEVYPEIFVMMGTDDVVEIDDFVVIEQVEIPCGY